MNKPTSYPERVLNKAIRKLWVVRLALYWERLWPAFWPSVFIVGLFVSATLFGLWEQIPAWLHLTLILLFIAELGA